MIKNQGRNIALAMIMVLLLIPLFWIQGDSVAYAATPTMKDSKIELVGEDDTYQLDIKDKVSGSTYKWSSSNTKVARVSSKGVVTAIGKGSATIKCKITYPTKQTKTLSCKVTVTIPATGLQINNANDNVNGAHTLTLGATYNFNRDIIPSNSSDKTYWSIAGGDPECISVVDSSSGIIKAVKPGFAVLMATAAKTATKEDAENSIVTDAVIIEVVSPSATVNSAEIVGSTEIKVVFDSPIDKNTVIGTNNALLDSIGITMKKNIKGVMAADPGTLTASLSSDLMTLVITSSNRFEGEYGINFTNKIKTTDGVTIEEYYKQMSYMDNIPPAVLKVELDDTGMIVYIRFTEAVDFTNLKVSNAALVPTTGSGTTAEPTTISMLNNKLNYMASEDKKSLSINLSKIAYSDFGKTFSVVLTGIKDMSGNSPSNYTLPIYLYTDITPKPQARLQNILRTSYYTLTAYFDRAIEYGGIATLSNGSSMTGVVDAKDPRKVNYTLTEYDAQKTGSQTVSIGYWNSYNVNPADTTASQPHQRPVNFDGDRTQPFLLKNEFDPQTNVLTLTYNKEVTIASNSGIFIARVITVTDEIRPDNNITYTKMPSEDPKVIKLLLGNMSTLGNYTFTIEKNLITDNFRNTPLSNSIITVSNTGGVGLELPGPYRITQSTTNPSQIYLDFANMLDIASAQNVNNYSIPGVEIVTAMVDKNTKESGATVILTVAEGSIDITIERPITITGLKGYGGTYGEMSEYTTTVELKDNKKPYYVAPPEFDRTQMNVIRLNFSEDIQGSMTVKVTEIGNYPYEIGNTVTVSGRSVIITLHNVPTQNAFLRIDIIQNNITDKSGNQSVPMTPQVGVPAVY